MEYNTAMYKSKYTPIKELPLTTTIPLLMEWHGESPYKIEEKSEGAIKQATLHRICTGATPSPKMPVISKIADYFGVEFSDLYNIQKIRSLVDGNQSAPHLIAEPASEYKSKNIRAEFIDGFSALGKEDAKLVREYVEFLLWKRSQK